MLISLLSLLALLAMSLSSAVRSLLGDAPVVLEGPSTLELAVIGGAVVAVYALVSRKNRQRQSRLESIAATQRLVSNEQKELPEEPSRGAA